jgi:hypothetical protein
MIARCAAVAAGIGRAGERRRLATHFSLRILCLASASSNVWVLAKISSARTRASLARDRSPWSSIGDPQTVTRRAEYHGLTELTVRLQTIDIVAAFVAIREASPFRPLVPVPAP